MEEMFPHSVPASVASASDDVDSDALLAQCGEDGFEGHVALTMSQAFQIQGAVRMIDKIKKKRLLQLNHWNNARPLLDSVCIFPSALISVIDSAINAWWVSNSFCEPFSAQGRHCLKVAVCGACLS